MSAARHIYLSPLEELPGAEEPMRFRLTYEGPLRPSQRDPEGDQPVPLAMHKHIIRRKFHSQLKRLWSTNLFLSRHTVPKGAGAAHFPAKELWAWGEDHSNDTPWANEIADQYREFGYRFVPLVREHLCLTCSLDILFLRADHPGGVLFAGDLDNRIKTLIDALRRPRNATELKGNEIPIDGEDPFYCLLEEDKLVTGLSVETDTLLDPPKDEADEKSLVKLVIGVTIAPYDPDLLTLKFA